MTATTAVLYRAANLLGGRLAQIEARLDAGEDLWSEYTATAEALARLAAATAPGANGKLMTTAEMAETLNVSTRQIRRLRKSGKIAPAAQLGGRTLRWRAEGGR